MFIGCDIPIMLASDIPLNQRYQIIGTYIVFGHKFCIKNILSDKTFGDISTVPPKIIE
ncbi:hypothetical protein D3C86_1189530 [compost metagenome]